MMAEAIEFYVYHSFQFFITQSKESGGSHFYAFA